jgi:hypothetical protein
MALRAIDVATRNAPSRTAAHTATVAPLRTPTLAPPDAAPRAASITELRPASRSEALAAARRERRRWLALGAVLFATPFCACVGVLEVVR